MSSALASALSGSHRHLYLTSATFKAEIDSLAFMLPQWVDAMAKEAQEQVGIQQAQIERMMREPMTFRFCRRVPGCGHLEAFHGRDGCVEPGCTCLSFLPKDG